MRGEVANTVPEEVEWQFAADDLEAVERWLLENPAVSAAETREISDTYLDTEDWTLYKSGYALRLRKIRKGGKEEAEATLKSLSPGREDGLHRRREISEPLESGTLTKLRRTSGPVGERLRALGARRTIRPIFEIQTRRQAFDLSGDGSSKDSFSGEVVLDTSTVTAEETDPTALYRAEVEIESGAVEDFEWFIEELRAGCGLREAAGSKFAAGLAASGLRAPGAPEKGPVETDGSLPAGEFAFAVLRRQFELFRYHEPGARLGEDPEELHDLRVASRRVRTALRLFKAVLPEEADGLRDELRWVASSLGEVRDFDVQLDSLERWRAGLTGEGDPEALEDLKATLEERRAKSRETMLRLLNSGPYTELVENLGAMLENGAAGGTGSGRPVREIAPEIIRGAYRKLRKAGDRITENSPPEDYHEVRKRARRLRYAVEFLRRVSGKPADEWIQRLKDLQDVLGDHQDAVVARENLRELALSSGTTHGPKLSPHTVFVMGNISWGYAAEEAGLRREFPKVYGEVKGKSRKKLQKKLDEVQAASNKKPKAKGSKSKKSKKGRRK